MRCPQCGVVYGLGQRFCTSDGADLVQHREDSPSAKQDPLIGKTLDGRYQIRCLLGEGGMGTVYEAKRTHTNRLFAVKILKTDYRDGETSIKRFLRESRVLSRLSHHHIVSIHDYGQSETGLYYLVMEHLHGLSLESYLKQKPGNRIYPGQMVEIMIQVAAALQYAHENNVVHRDIKPSNIMLTIQDGQGDFVKILDFGIARLLDQEGVTKVSPPCTISYAAPEFLIEKDDYLTPAIDMYSLGGVMYECLVGEPPFTGNANRVMYQQINAIPSRVSEKRKDVTIPKELDALVAQLLDKNPERRPSAKKTTEILVALRPKLPQRSVQSLLYMNTKILSQPGPQATIILNEVGRIQQIINDVDALDSILAQTSTQLAKRTRTVIRKLWHDTPPSEIGRLLSDVKKLETHEEDTAVQVALRREEIHQARRDALRQQAIQQERFLELRDQERHARPKIAATIQVTLAKLEQENQDIEEQLRGLSIDSDLRRLDNIRMQLHELRGNLADKILQVVSAQIDSYPKENVQLLQTLKATLEEFISVLESYRDTHHRLSEG
ncbi:MAG TPA: protein kinase [Pseudomonadota bacterium]|nr:protein kinase [Pseudomonadota bacterium]